MKRTLNERIAVAHQAVQALEHAADQAWRRARPYYLPRPLLRSTERLDAWWELADAARIARARFHRLVELRDERRIEVRLDVLRGAGVPDLFSSSWGVPGSRRGMALPAPSAGPASTAPDASLPDTMNVADIIGWRGVSSVPASSEDNSARAPDGYTGTPQPRPAMETGSTAREAADQAPGRATAAPPLCMARAPRAACAMQHRCTRELGHDGAHRSVAYGCSWPTAGEAPQLAAVS